MGEFARLTAATLLGALISFVATLFFERRKEQRAEQTVKQQDGRQLRQAARLVLDELVGISVMIDAALYDNEWWSSPPHDVTQRLWLEYQATLAALLDEGTWDVLGTTYAWMTNFNVWLSMAREGMETSTHDKQLLREPISGRVITKAWRQELISLNTEIGYALKALRPTLGAQTDAKR